MTQTHKKQAPKTAVDILKLGEQVVDEYRSYVESFLDISDPDLRNYAQQMLQKGDLWPEPYLQCNPGFKKGETIDQLVRNNKPLHPEMEHIFSGFHLHKHQEEAILLGARDKGFIVTSGTGSGKSLTYLGSIFNGVLQKGYQDQKGVCAIIVYPMNALINSQYEEIKSLEDKYLEKFPNQPFPISYKMYTGQESAKERAETIKNPPHILLTNYMMLELLMTRSKEAELRKSIFKNLEYLVFDELHWYRGRQGADVAMLIRRIKAATEKPLLCMGTSATLSSGKLKDQKQAVAELGKQLFDENYQEDQIIAESLVPSITVNKPNPVKLGAALKEKIDTQGSKEYLENLPLAAWIEREIALGEEEDNWIRGAPITIEEICQKMYEQASLGLSEEEGLKLCRTQLGKFLQLLQHVNQGLDTQILPFRVHQFVAQTATIKVTLEAPGQRKVEATEERLISRKDQKMPLIPVYFHRQSGCPYLSVQLDDNQVAPWDHDEGEEDDSQTKGYLIWESQEEESLWNETQKEALLPDSWFDTRKKVKKDKEDFLPRKMYVTPSGEFSNDPIKNGQAVWFIKDPIRIDLLSGIVYDGKTRRSTILAQPGDAGRSISTTILSYSVLRQLRGQLAPEKIQKVMSFTDNRQDAALQAGHFNDFLQQAFLRSAIHQALKKNRVLTYDNIAKEVFDQMQLQQEEYALKPGGKRWQIKENEGAFKSWLSYQIFLDLRRGWRHRLPNLEQCGLLNIAYKQLEEESQRAETWQASPFLTALPAEDRYHFLVQVLNYIRTSFSVYHHSLERGAIEIEQHRIKDKLNTEWLVEEGFEIREPNWMRIGNASIHKNVYSQSIGPSSALGRYIQLIATEFNIPLEGKDLANEIEKILHCLDDHKPNPADKEGGAGYLRKSLAYGEEPLYQLNIDTIEWKLGNGENTVADEVRTRSRKERTPRVNPYFKELYQQNPRSLKQLLAKEHTGQVPAETRKDIEDQFKAAQIKALYCSPTMELGIDISELSVVHLRNVPPSPANYAQRSGRAGRKGQGALILTFCSKKSAHDRHFFKNRMDMVAGKVRPQKLDLTNPDLLKSHLQACYLTACHIEGFNQSLDQLLDIEKKDLPLLANVKSQLQLSDESFAERVDYFNKVIEGLKEELESKDWFTSTWVADQMKQVPFAFNEACHRWRQMYLDAHEAREKATIELKKPDFSKSSKEWKEANAALHQAQRKIDLLRNKTLKKDYSEFYPYRYFASEGFLPGYNFTRLPVRIFLNDMKEGGGSFISRPRLLAIAEFGPENTIYHLGRKWKVKQMRLPPSQEGLLLQRASIDENTHFLTMGSEGRKDIEAIGGGKKSLPKESNLLSLEESTAGPYDKISCQEDARTKESFELDVYFSYAENLKRARRIEVTHLGERLLCLHWLPAATLWKMNRKRKGNKNGFRIHAQSGHWKTEKQYKEIKDNEEEQGQIKEVQLITSVTTDCLYIEPLKNLQLDEDGCLTLTYALKKAIEEYYHAEPQELAAQLMGDAERPNVLFYENAEGSLGVLSRLFKNEKQFAHIIEKAIEVCAFDSHVESPATYNDLLTYYNQRDHRKIDRFLIKDTLQLLSRANIDLGLNNGHKSYTKQYQKLLDETEANDDKSKEFLGYLNQHKLPLPEHAKCRPEGCSVTFHFYYQDQNAGILLDKKEPVGKESTAGLLTPEDLGIRVVKQLPEQSIEDLVKSHLEVFSPFQS